MNEFVLGLVAMGAATLGLLFTRYWKTTGESLFVFFAVAFSLLALNWTLLAFANRDEPNTALYGVRLVAFLLILVGIWNKNRRGIAAKPPRQP
jgi:hypothetical protein